MKNVNSQYFNEEQIKAGEFSEFLSLLMKQCYGKGDNYNDIHIRPEDCGAFSVEWTSSPWDHSYGGRFEYVEEDQAVMTEYTFPDNHYEMCFDEEDFNKRLTEFLNDHPEYNKKSY